MQEVRSTRRERRRITVWSAAAWVAAWIAAAALLAGAWAVVTGTVAGNADEDADTPSFTQAAPLSVALDFVVPVYQGGAERFRTPATIDTALAEELGKRLRRPVTIVGPNAGPNTGLITGLIADGDPVLPRSGLRIAPLGGRPPPPEFNAIPLDYRAAPMAIMRSDSQIRHWNELWSRTVCIAVGGHYVGKLQREYGAIEIVHPSPTDALIALRTGECDAMVHDSAMLEKLIRLPEWKKFSRTLPRQAATTLALLVPRGEPGLERPLRRIVADWKAAGFVDGLVTNAVRNIAFEVYLQQEVPDCH